MTEAATVEDRFKGALLGCAIGDALGAPVEGWTASDIADCYGTVTDFIDERFGAGMVTDDTQMTVVLAQAILELGRFDRAHAALKMGQWMKYSDDGIKPARGPGKACATACRRMYQGVPIDECALPSAGCGAAMRAAPIGLRYYHDHEALKRAAVEQARLTHSKPEAAAGSVVVALMVALGIERPEALDPLAAAAAFVEDISPEMAGVLVELSDYHTATLEEGFAFTGRNGYVMETVPAALLAFLHSPNDFEQTVVNAVNAGGDTDSIAAIAGAISGAFNGTVGMPQRWLDGVEGRSYLESLATKLFTLTPAAKALRRPIL